MKKLINTAITRLRTLAGSIKAQYRIITASVFSLCLTASGAFATEADGSDIASSKIATGTEKLINDLTTWLLIIAPIAGTVCIIYFAIRRGAADEQEQKQWDNRIKTAIISVLLAVLASVIIKIIVGYYQ